jgi:hypothetical protein
MFVAVNCAEDMEEDRRPPWIEAACRSAAKDGGLRKVYCYRNPSKDKKGSNAMPILIGPCVAGYRHQPLEQYGWLPTANIHSCHVSWLFNRCVHYQQRSKDCLLRLLLQAMKNAFNDVI